MPEQAARRRCICDRVTEGAAFHSPECEEGRATFRAPVSPVQAEADRVIDYGLTLAMYGERAPGGDETWREFGAMAEDYMRRRGCALRGAHQPDDPRCSDCGAQPGAVVAARFRYDGLFDLTFLREGESVVSAGDGTGACRVSQPDGPVLRLELGQVLERQPDGLLLALGVPRG